MHLWVKVQKPYPSLFYRVWHLASGMWLFEHVQDVKSKTKKPATPVAKGKKGKKEEDSDDDSDDDDSDEEEEVMTCNSKYKSGIVFFHKCPLAYVKKPVLFDVFAI